MIGIERDLRLSSINTDVFSTERQHMEISPQDHVALCRGDMLACHDRLPRTSVDAVFTVKIDLCRRRGLGLHTDAVVEPHQTNGKQDQEEDPRNLQI